MGRSGHKTAEVQSIDSSLSLFRLPNEILEMILSYFSSGDLILAFWDINSARMQSLIQHYLFHFDLSSIISNEEEWMKNYFPGQSHCLLSLRLTDKQIKLLSKSNIHFNQLVSLHIIHIENNRLFQIDVARMGPLIRSLALDFLSDEMSHDSIGCLARILFSSIKPWQEQLEKLSINHIHLPFGFNSLQSMPNLRHLTINLRSDSQLFELCSYLPNIESFRVDVRHSSQSLSNSSFNPANASLYLKKLIISGYFSSHLSLYQFILIYQSSLVYLKLMNIVHSDLVDGHQLRSKLVQNLSPTIRFHFHLQMPINKQEISLDSYRNTFNWRPVLLEEKIDEDSTIIVVSSLPPTSH